LPENTAGWSRSERRAFRGAESVSVKRKQQRKKPRAKPDLRIQGIGFKDALRALLNSPPMPKNKR
jgi:hypothetical protein